MILGDMVAGFVFAWFYLAVAGSFAPGVPGGHDHGFLHGRADDLPGGDLHVPHVRGFPYYLSWIWIFYAIVLYVCAGAIAAAINKR